MRAGGTVTAGNASGVNDGAVALILASADAAEKYGLTPLVSGSRHGDRRCSAAGHGHGPGSGHRKAHGTARAEDFAISI